jgi:hypothetical protein
LATPPFWLLIAMILVIIRAFHNYRRYGTPLY